MPLESSLPSNSESESSDQPSEPQAPLAEVQRSAEVANSARAIQEYFYGAPELLEHYSAVRADILHEVDEFAADAQGTELEENARRLAEDFRQNFDSIAQQIFLIVDLANRDSARRRFLDTTTDFDLTLIRSLHENTKILATAHPDDKEIRVYLHPENFDSYQSFRSTIIHELAHLFLEVHDHTKETIPGLYLKEGITELISQLVSEESEIPNVYIYQTRLARALFQLDRDILFDWYFSGDVEDFEKRLSEKLQQVWSYPQEVAADIARDIVSIDHEIRRARLNRLRLIVDAKTGMKTLPDTTHMAFLERLPRLADDVLGRTNRGIPSNFFD